MESWALDGVELNDGVNMKVIAPDVAPARKRLELVSSSDSDGAVLLRDPKTDVLVWRFALRVPQQASMDLALQKLASVTAKLDEAGRNPDGLPLVWTPDGSSFPLTYYVLVGEVVELPTAKDDAGWVARSPLATIELTCKPFGYGAWESIASATSSAQAVTLELPDVKGDVPAEGRIVVTDTAGVARRFVEAGIECRNYDPSTSLTIAAAGLATTGFSGTLGTYNSNDAVNAGVAQQPTAVCGTGPLTHVGAFRVRARLESNTSGVMFRFAYRVGDGALQTGPWVALDDWGANWADVDLGVVSVPSAVVGTHAWEGRIEAYTTGSAAGSQASVGSITFVPVDEWYGRARAKYRYQTGATVAADNFTSTTSGGALNARVLPTGQTWTTGGIASDFLFADAPGSSDETVKRQVAYSVPLARRALIGVNVGAFDIGVRLYIDGETGSSDFRAGLVARWFDVSNYLQIGLRRRAATSDWQLFFNMVDNAIDLSGTTATIDPRPSEWLMLRVVGHINDTFVAQLLTDGGELIAEVHYDATTNAPFALNATGDLGLADNGGVVAHYYDDFYYAVPEPEQVVIHPSQSVEFRHDGTFTADSTGTTYARPTEPRGGNVLIPPAGDNDDVSRLLVHARRNDPETLGNMTTADEIHVEVFARPRYRMPKGAA